MAWDNGCQTPLVFIPDKRAAHSACGISQACLLEQTPKAYMAQEQCSFPANQRSAAYLLVPTIYMSGS